MFLRGSNVKQFIKVSEQKMFHVAVYIQQQAKIYALDFGPKKILSVNVDTPLSVLRLIILSTIAHINELGPYI